MIQCLSASMRPISSTEIIHTIQREIQDFATAVYVYIHTSLAAHSLSNEVSFIHLHLMLALVTFSDQSSPRGHLQGKYTNQ
jgi:hypothetical protein